MPGKFASRAPWKRSACDRCRAQKLRCHRDEEGSTEACLRCLKSGAKCVTSTARPTGRPPSRLPPRIDQTDNSSSSQTINSSPGGTGNEADIDMIGLDYEMSVDSFLHSIGIQHSDLITNDDILVDASLPSQSTSQRGVSPILVPSQNQVEASSSHSASYQFNGMPGAGPTDPGLPIWTDDVELMLSKLHSELCAQLFSIRSVPWDVKGTLSLTVSHKGNGEELETSEPHPLVQVSKVSTKLERLLVGLRPPGTAQHATSAFSYTPSFTPRLRTTQLLVALSCYIQIVSIYDIIFSKVFDFLTNSSKTLIGASQSSTPTLYLGGLPIPPDQTLSGSLLVHLTEHQLHQVEQLMGLPEHYRVSSRLKDGNKDGEMGLFGGQSCQSLLNAVIQLGEDREGNHDDIRGVRSLKLKMRQIKDI
ncbi:hypothetical protein BKA56DRAFT_569269 [Ilyonectria sp. MPI-CAGE-AT-0026]|nr:hypothetical protein BKA56DRAFT_569269 [Ilyonectria sp. MPI-CAGE-AT-0026]